MLERIKALETKLGLVPSHVSDADRVHVGRLYARFLCSNPAMGCGATTLSPDDWDTPLTEAEEQWMWATLEKIGAAER